MGWPLVIEEKFTHPKLSEKWQVEAGNWRVQDGELFSKGYGEVRIFLPANSYHVLEAAYEICSDNPGGIHCEIGPYLFGFGIDGNLWNGISRNGEVIAQTFDPAIQPGKIHHLIARVAEAEVLLIIDGKEVLKTPRETAPLLGGVKLVVCGEGSFRSVRVRGVETLSGVSTRKIVGQKPRYQFQITIDFEDDIGEGPFTKKMFADMVDCFADWGLSRIYWMYRGGKNGGIWDPVGDPPAIDSHVKNSLKNIGDFLPAMVKLAHARGLEVYSLIKPFDMCGAPTYPEGSPKAKRFGKIERLGGQIFYAPNFLRDHPDLRIERNMAGIAENAGNQIVRAIRFVKHDDQPSRIKRSDLEIWVSNDDKTYHKYARPFKFREQVETRFEPIYGTQKNSVSHKKKPVRIICLDGLEIPEKYFAVTTPFKDANGTFKNWLFALTEVVSDQNQPIPFTYGLHVRGNRMNGYLGDDFRRTGFEFDFAGDTLAMSLGPARSVLRSAWFLDNKKGVIGFAQGKNRYLPGAPCEVDREVKDFWLSWVKQSLEAGVDGVDFRIRAHNTSLEWEAYGFNDVIVKEYQKRYGVDIRTQDFDREKWRRLRGEHYTSFLREAKKLIESAGKKMQHHICSSMQGEPARPTMMEIHWNWRQWIAEGLLDAITFKEVYPETAFYEEVRAVADKKSVPAYFCPFFWSALHGDNWKNTPEKLFRLSSEAGDDGFIIYECAALVRGKPDGTIRLVHPKLKLKEVIAKFRR